MLLRYERRCLLAIFETILPSGASAELPLGASDAPLDAFLDVVLRDAPVNFRLGLHAFTWVVALAPLFVLGRWTTFMGLASTERLALLEAMRVSEAYVVREIPLFFKMTACLGFCGLPEVQRRVGFTAIDLDNPPWARRLPIRAS